MDKYTEVVVKAGDRVLSLVGNAQQTFVSAVGTVTEMVAGALPKLPTIPFPAILPTPHEVVDQSFSFAGRILDTQKAYATGLLDAIEPLTGKIVGNGTATKRNGSKKSPAKTTV